MNNYRILALIILSMFIYAFAFAKSPAGPKLEESEILIVPIKAQSISMNSPMIPVPDATQLVQKLIARGVIDKTTKGKRMNFADLINDQLSDFQPEVVFAEEFLNALKKTKGLQPNKIKIRKELFVLEDSSVLLDGHARPFDSKKTGLNKFKKWNKIDKKWKKAPPALLADHSSEMKSSDLVFEIYINNLAVWRSLVLGSPLLKFKAKGLTIWWHCKIIDSKSNKVLEIIGRESGAAPMEKFTSDSDPQIFVDEFRRIANKSAMKALEKLKF